MDPVNSTQRQLPDYDFSILSPHQRLRLIIEDAINKNKVQSKSDFAERLGLPPYALSRLLSGELAITQSIAGIVEGIFGIPTAWLLQGIANLES